MVGSLQIETAMPMVTEFDTHGKGPSKPNSILIAEDCEFNLTALSCQLQQFELQADLCMNGRDAVDLVVKRLETTNSLPMYKLIILDYSMPELDGP